MGAPAVSPRRRPARKAPARAPARTGARRAPGARAAARTAPARAPAKRVPARRAPARRTPARAPRRQPERGRTPAGGIARLPLTAVGRTAGAVGGIADSGLMIGMTRGRRWIAVLGLLLGGIVALNVWGLSLSASSAATATKIAELERENSVLRGRLANRLSSAAVAEGASGLGLGVASPHALRYTKPDPGDAARAAERISSGQLSALPALPVAPELALAGAEGAVEAAAPAEDPVAPATDPGVESPAAAPPPEGTQPLEPAPSPAPGADPASAVGGVAP